MTQELIIWPTQKKIKKKKNVYLPSSQNWCLEILPELKPLHAKEKKRKLLSIKMGKKAPSTRLKCSESGAFWHQIIVFKYPVLYVFRTLAKKVLTNSAWLLIISKSQLTLLEKIHLYVNLTKMKETWVSYLSSMMIYMYH